MYSLPAADAARPVRAVLYAVVTAAEVRLAAVPVVRLRGDDRMDRRLVPGGHFPGTPVHVAELAARRAELRAQLAALHPDSEALARRQTPLLLADRALPARQVFAVAEALSVQRVRLAVAGLSARAHSVALGHAPETGSAAPLLDVRPDAFAITASRSVTIPRGAPDSPDGAPDSPDGAPGGQNDATARAQLVAELSQIALMQAPEDRVELKDSSDMTVAELAQLLDAIAEARFTTLLYRPSAGAATRAKPGSSAPRE
jgi:hypothetical protein